ncbi:hypothetical protein [Streptomyces sp. NPDC094144]|uniref:hypothetical protein n=1 Tax=Streptomyces sp. NPDC094144 TaxID=3366056 RepID=UPI00382E8FC3
MEKIEGNADVPAWVTSRTFPNLTYVSYSEYHDASASELGDALTELGPDADAADAVEYWEKNGVSSAKEAQFEAHVTDGDLLALCKFALGRLPERSVVLVRNFDSDSEVSANMTMGAGDTPGGCKEQ